MSQELPPGQDKEEVEALARLIASNLADGEDPDEIARQLIESGWKTEDAHGFVGAIHQQIARRGDASSASDEGYGWLMWIGGVLLINLLSWVFGWGFFIW